jgi:hypothetical protein
MRRIWWRTSAMPAADASVLSDHATGRSRSAAVADRVTAAINALLSATVHDARSPRLKGG